MKKKLIREAQEILNDKDIFEELYASEINKMLEEEEPPFDNIFPEELAEEYL